MSDALAAAVAATLLDPAVWAAVIAAACYGVFIGALPGLTATMGVALFVPVTFWMPTVPALAAIATMVACAIFAGDIPTTLLRIPGTPASAAYADDAYRLARDGRAGAVLGTALVASVVGGLVGALVLILAGRELARVATLFSAAEYFWLSALGLSCAVLVGGGSVPRAVASLACGLLLASVGLSAVHAQPRFTFGRPELLAGIGFIPAMIGLFGLAEVLRAAIDLPRDGGDGGDGDVGPPLVHGPLVLPACRRLARRVVSGARSAAIGVLVGVLPGAGADIASWVAAAASRAGRATRIMTQANARKSNKPNKPTEVAEPAEPTEATEAALDSIADACTANSASLAGAWIPALVFGIPGDSVTAMVIGVLAMKNLQPGPEIFQRQASLVYGLYISFILANLVLLPVGLVAIRGGGLVMRVPRRVLLPLIVMLCVVGSFAINARLFDVAVMLAFGLVGLACGRLAVPVGPMVLGIVLGGQLEERFVQTLAGGRGSLLAFIDRPVACGLAVAWLAIWATVLARRAARGRSGFSRSKSVVYL
jgi:putative tricarboxylic transport membrane protein